MLVPTGQGSFTHVDDPGEPGGNGPRVSVTEEEATLLSRLACGKRVLEIGTGTGFSSRAIKASAVSLTTLDIDPWVHSTIFPTLRALGISCCADRIDAAAHGPFDLIFIDGNHSSDTVFADINYAVPLLCSAGLLLLHDFINDGGVQNAASAAGLKTYPLGTKYGLTIAFKE